MGPNRTSHQQEQQYGLEDGGPAGDGISWTVYLVLYSLIYHTMKSRGVRQDALRRYSPTLGIMRVVIDKFYVHTTVETILTLARLSLQGLDTYIHYRIVRDMLLGWDNNNNNNNHHDKNTSSLRMLLHILFTVWVLHAALINQLFRCSTASVMVQAWSWLTASSPSKTRPPPRQITDDDESLTTSQPTVMDGVGKDPKRPTDNPNDDNDDDDSTEAESVSSGDDSSDSSIDEEDPEQDFVVRRLLRPGRVADDLKGRRGAATGGVDTAIRIETTLAILASLFIVGLGEVPLRILSLEGSYGLYNIDRQRIGAIVPYVWLVWSLLHGIWAFFLKTRPQVNNRHSGSDGYSRARLRSLINILDLCILIGSVIHLRPESRWSVFTLAAAVTWKSFFQAAGVSRPTLIWTSMLVSEFLGKALLVRSLAKSSNQSDTALGAAFVALVWGVWTVSNPVPTPCEVASQTSCTMGAKQQVADAVFLGHPAELSDCWALWLLPYPLKERWQRPWWSIPLWPLHYVVGLYVVKYRQRLFGDKTSFFCCDDVVYGGTRMQTWTAAHFGRHFVTHPRQVKANIEAAARHAEESGVKVLCLGALNKAESINGGGLGVVKALGPERRLSVIHGNHLTAAAVVETTYQCFGKNAKVFLTGASSKVGWAVAQALKERYGYEILCHSTDKGRRDYFESQGFTSASKLSEGMSFSNLWIVGKYDRAVAKLIPQNACAVVFSVPHPLESRQDVRVVEAGTLHMDMCQLDRPRRFTNKLKNYEIFACHAASAVAAYRLKRDGVKRIDEIGPVNPNEMDEWLEDAKKIGFHVPAVSPAVSPTGNRNFNLNGTPAAACMRHPVIVVGAGPAGLAVGASLRRSNIPSFIVDVQSEPSGFGSWDKHFSGLEVTSQKKWCNLPGFAMDEKEFPGENVTATDYQRYLELYAARFGLEIRRGIQVTSIEKGNEMQPWIVRHVDSNQKDETFTASSVIVATGKHRIPQRNTEDDLASRLAAARIPILHSTDLVDDATWSKAIRAAQEGRLCLVGFGNSAADLATAILQHCDEDGRARIHVAARTVPPVFPRRRAFLRVDTLGYLVRSMPDVLQEIVIRLLWWGIPSSRQCDAAFPAHLDRWSKIRGRVPVVDKYGVLASSFQSGRLVGHGPVAEVFPSSPEAGGNGAMSFQDRTYGSNRSSRVPVDLVILATGYKQDCIISREDRLNGLFKCGFGNDRLLPLQSIGEEAETIANEIARSYKY